MDESKAKTAVAEFFDGSLGYLEEQIKADPVRAIYTGLIFGAGLVALDVNSLRKWMMWVAKLTTSEMIKDIPLNVHEESQPIYPH